MIGFYNYSVILTYIGLASSVIGMTQALEGHFKLALVCLIISGGCDMFDGKIARAMDRTEDEKKFGIQIDSLCDLVCFGVFPAILGYALGIRGTFGNFCLVCYILAAVIRLGFFNVMEEKRQAQTNENRKLYQGLPVTSIAILFPLIYLVREHFRWFSMFLFSVAMLVIAILFISDIQVKKPGNRTIGLFVVVVLIVVAKMFGLF